MIRGIRSRLVVLALGVLILCGFLVYSLNQVAVAQSTELSRESEDRASKTITLKGERGKILDMNGLPLAFNQKSYNIQFYRDDIDVKRSERYRPLYTEIMQKTIAIVEKYGGATIDTFAIRRDDETGEFAFYWGDISKEAATKRETNWRKNMQVSTDAAPKELYNTLRRRFYIPEELEYKEAIKLLSIWQEVQLSTYRSYEPVTIAYNVNIETVSEIETRSIELDGMQTAESRVRIYPKSDTAAHVVGYEGKINAEDAELYVNQLGYGYEDEMGVAGIEKTMEQYLTANTTEKKGKKVIETSQSGQIIRTLDTVQPQNGNDVVLTIDLALQQVAEDALEKNINEINAEQHRLLLENYDYYASRISNTDDIMMAKMGAVVVMDISNGDVLAMANFPSYDANLFTGGIAHDDFAKLNDDEAKPLFNKAIASKAMPGSIFKVFTGLVGLQEGAITVDEKIDDKSPYVRAEDIGKNLTGLPGCWTKYTSRHSQEDIVKALKDSCNYYFYTVADRLGIDKLAEWGTRFGLDCLTNIELPGETVGQVGGQRVQYDNTLELNQQKTYLPRMVDTELQKLLRKYCEQMGLAVTDEQVSSCSGRLIKLVDDNTQIGKQIRVAMREELGIPEAVSNTNYWHMEVSSLLAELRWTPYQTIRTGIGQAVIQVTPISIARYYAAVLNGGTVYDAHIVKRIIDENGRTVKEFVPTVHDSMKFEPLYIEKIKEGLKGVVSPEDGGTAADYFEDFEYLDQLGGKTGTAQISFSQNNIDLQNTSTFVAFTPFEKPEIVIVVYIPNGLSGSKGSTTVREIVKFYLDRKSAEAVENLPDVNGMMQ